MAEVIRRAIVTAAGVDTTPAFEVSDREYTTLGYELRPSQNDYYDRYSGSSGLGGGSAFGDDVAAVGRGQLRARPRLWDNATTTFRPRIGRQVLQLSLFPQLVDVARYRNGGTAADIGDFGATARFHALVDPVPDLGLNYVPSANSTEQIYERALGANSEDADIAKAFLDAKRRFDQSVLFGANKSLNFHPSYPDRQDWYSDRWFNSTSVDFRNRGSVAEAGFELLRGNDADSFEWSVSSSVDGGPEARQRASAQSEVDFRCGFVKITRPWLKFDLFATSGWFLSGLKKGWFSNGRLGELSGQMALVPTGFIVCSSVTVSSLTVSERKMVLRALDERKSLTYGPFALADENVRGTISTDRVELESIQILGWISQVLPLSPPVTGLSRRKSRR